MALDLVLYFATDASPLILFEAGDQSVSRCGVQQEGVLFTVWLLPTVLVAQTTWHTYACTLSDGALSPQYAQYTQHFRSQLYLSCAADLVSQKFKN